MSEQLNGVHVEPLYSREAAALRETWPCKLLAYLHEHGDGRERMVGFHILMLEFPNAIQTLARVAIPGFIDVNPPFLHEYASITPGGRVVAEVTHKSGTRLVTVLYRNKDEMVSVFRQLADKLKFRDLDRVAMFGVLGKFVVCDLGIDHEGRRKVS